jgi:quinol monooxygenase YgiN
MFPPSAIVVVATVRVVPEHLAVVEPELHRLVPVTREETGCLNYDLHRDRADPSVFVFHETWESEADLDRHLQAPHIQAFVEATRGRIAELDVKRLDRIA